MAQTSSLSSNCEVSLMKLNAVFLLKVGILDANVARVLRVPRREGFQEYRWIAHTHPFEYEDLHPDNQVPVRAGGADRRARNEIARTWGEQTSYVVNCRGGRVLSVVGFPE